MGELELKYSDSAHIGIFLAGVKWAAPKWISVKERLPEEEEGGKFLVCFSGGNRHLYYFTLDDGFYHPTYSSDTPVTHWMPLPEPPKEEEVGK